MACGGLVFPVERNSFTLSLMIAYHLIEASQKWMEHFFCALFLAVFVEHLGSREAYEGVCSSHRSSWFVCFALAGDRAAAESHMLSRRLMLASALGSK